VGSDGTAVLQIEGLSDRHPGVTKALGDGFAEAAGVCLHRHHLPPQKFHVVRGEADLQASITWQSPTIRTIAAHANENDATEAGAYAMVLAGVELTDRLVAVARAETLTGADYYLLHVGEPLVDLEGCIRLEISGVGRGPDALVYERLRRKRKQAAAGDSSLPAIAGVVGFEAKRLIVADVDLAP
jgi:hypothetical protein